MISKEKLRVAFYVYPTAFQAPGGGEVQLLKTKQYLEAEGAEVRLFDPWRDKLQSFDIFHTFGSVKDCLEMIKTADTLGVKTVLSTICWYSWRSALGIYGSPDQKLLALLRQSAKSFFPFIPSLRKSIMEYSDLLFPNSQTEAKQLKRYFCVPEEKIFVVPNGVDPSFMQAAPDRFIEEYRLKNFILCVGRIEPRKNQLNMIRALRNTSIPVVFIGDYVHQYRSYYQLCRREAGPNMHFLGAIQHDHELLRSAYAACNTFLLASWLETPGLAALEAGLAGAKVAITSQGATQEYFREFATYVNPGNLDEIRKNTLKTFEGPKNESLQQHIKSHYLWPQVARRTIEGYQLLTRFHKGVRSLKGSSHKSERIHVGIDLQSLRGRKTGLGVYTEQLVKTFFDIKPESFYFHFYSRKDDRELNTFDRWIWENIRLSAHSWKDNNDILHVPAFAPPYWKTSKLIVTVHDLIGMLFPNQLRWPSALYWGKWLPYTLKRADAIIADSNSTKEDLMRHLHIPESKIHVIYLSGHEGFSAQISSPEIQAVKHKYGILQNYFLFVGTLEPRKNLERVIEAFALFLKKRKEKTHQLVVVGSKEFGHGKFFQSLLKKTGITHHDILFTGYASHEDLNALYCGADIFVYPSLYEGFGIPILEAMASGTPVLTANRTSTPEVAGDAAYLVDPYQTEAIAAGMTEITQNKELRAGMTQKGFERIKIFSWKKTAQATLDVYRKVMKI